MELEDYGLTVRIMDSYTSDEIRGRVLMDLPLPYPGHPCSFGIELDGEMLIMATVSKVANKKKRFFIKVSVWEDGESHLESVDNPEAKANPNDLREAIMTLAAPLIQKHHAHFTQSFRTHFERLAQAQNYPLSLGQNSGVSSIKSGT